MEMKIIVVKKKVIELEKELNMGVLVKMIAR